MKNVVMGCLLSFFAFFAAKAQASVVSGFDQQNKCTLYRVLDDTKEVKAENEIVVNPNSVYGLNLANMEINFQKQIVLVDIHINVVMGFNRVLTSQKAFIAHQNPNFTTLINELNRKVQLLNKICIAKNNEIIYAERAQ
jgi:hypothetical protein